MRITVYFFLILTCLLACSKNDDIDPIETKESNLKFFGFTLVDTYWDDPTDVEVQINYADEVHTFSNIADILVVNPTDNIIQRVRDFNELEMKAVLHLNELFFELIDTNSLSGSNYDLRADYNSRWQEFVIRNKQILTINSIGAFYIGEEATWNGISFSELDIVTNLIKSEFFNIPIMIIEAYPALNELRVPENADWIGFDHYFIKDPSTDVSFQNEWQILKSKLSSPSQRIILVMDSHYINWAHGDFGGIDITEMDVVANNYYGLAKSDTTVVGIMGYFWPNGFDTPESIGARGMPQKVRDEYNRIGKEITEK